MGSPLASEVAAVASTAEPGRVPIAAVVGPKGASRSLVGRIAGGGAGEEGLALQVFSGLEAGSGTPHNKRSARSEPGLGVEDFHQLAPILRPSASNHQHSSGCP